MRLDGKTAIITGAAQGIGRAVALEFAAEGADMLLADIQGAKVAQTAADVQRRGRRAVVLSTDVTAADQVEAMVQRAQETFGRVDILVNDAGGSGDVGIRRIDDVSEDRWGDIVDLNLKSAFLCCRAVVGQMREQGYGRIVNISSSTARGTFGDLAPRPSGSPTRPPNRASWVSPASSRRTWRQMGYTSTRFFQGSF
jgi:NAD(P)-dependent dehydrogenase (short-subunit alcohol dehydrogenase family)